MTNWIRIFTKPPCVPFDYRQQPQSLIDCTPARLRTASVGVLVKLAEVSFIEVPRLHMREQGEGQTEWLDGVGDRIVGPAVNALHARPAHAWMLDELAHSAGTSRSVLAERFQHLVGS